MQLKTVLFPALLACLSASRLWAEVPAVTTDIPAVHSLTSQVMGDLGDPSLLVAGPADLHHFQLRPSQAQILADADIVFWIGSDLTPWLARALDTLGSDARSVALIDDPDTFQIKSEGGHGHSGRDPHVWLDPKNAIVWLDIIARELSSLDPENSAVYIHNSKSAIEKIQSLLLEISAKMSQSGPLQIITTHDAFDHFANRFKISIAGSVSDGEAKKPTAAHMKKLQEILRNSDIRCVFREPQQSTAALDALTDGQDLKIGVLDPAGNTLQPGAKLYSELIRNLADAITDCASQPE